MATRQLSALSPGSNCSHPVFACARQCVHQRKPLGKLFVMSGHSKWATTKHQKAVKDQRRAKSFAKLIKNIEVAAKLGGADLSGNPTLVDAIQKAKKTSVPNSNIDNAVKRGSGQLGEVVDYQTIMYEGYAAGGVALLIECLTDNKNRAAANVRTVMSRNGGTMGDPGSVAYNFSRKGVISVTKTDAHDEDDILGAVLDAGAEEVNDRGAGFEIVTEPQDMVAARTALTDAGIEYDSADVEFVPGITIDVDLETAKKIFRLIDALDDDDDVQNVYGNFSIPADVQAQLDDEEE
jgi:YebC/PmpR family DNA-binding regulatory protein